MIDDRLCNGCSLIKVCHLVTVLYAQGNEGLGQVHTCSALTSAAIFGRNIPRESSIGVAQILDGNLIGLLAAGTVISVVRGFGILDHQRNTTENLGQTQIGKTAEELGLTGHTGLGILAGPGHFVHLGKSQVGIGDHLVELVPDALGQGGSGGPGSGEVAHVLSRTQLVLVVHHIGTGEGVVAKALSHGAGEIEFLELKVTRQKRIHNLIGCIVGIGNRKLGFGLFVQEFLI